MKILYVTKAWAGDFRDVLNYHPNPDLIIGNNLGFKFVDMGNTSEPYFIPEIRAIYEADAMGAEHILWYASDVQPPEQDWTEAALPLLDRYPIVSPFWEKNYDDYVRTAFREKEKSAFHETEFGFEDYCFSDQSYLAKVSTMRSIDYGLTHPVRELYPVHGGNSFECRVAQWLASTGQKRAVLKDFSYRHTPKDEK